MGELQINKLTISDWKVYGDGTKLVFKHTENEGEVDLLKDHNLTFYNSIPSDNISSHYSTIFNRVFFHFETIVYNKEDGYLVECQLPINARSSAVGTAVIKNPFDNKFQSNMASVQIINNVLQIRSNMFNRKYSFVVNLSVDINYEKA